MKKNAKVRMKKRRDRFVVGYIGALNLAFGRRDAPHPESVVFRDCARPLTRRQAEVALANMPCADCAVFELVPVLVNR